MSDYMYTEEKLLKKKQKQKQTIFIPIQSGLSLNIGALEIRFKSAGGKINSSIKCIVSKNDNIKYYE